MKFYVSNSAHQIRLGYRRLHEPHTADLRHGLLLATGCARANLAPTAATPASEHAAKAPTKAADADAEAEKAAPEALPSESAEVTGARKAGDFIVYRFSGASARRR